MNLVSLLLQNKLSHRTQLGPKMSYITRIMYWIDLGADGVVPQGPTPFWQLRKNIKEKEKRSRKEKRTRNDQMMGGLGPSSLIHTPPTPYHLHHHPPAPLPPTYIHNGLPKGNMWSAIPVALRFMIVNWSEGKQGSGPKGDKVL